MTNEKEIALNDALDKVFDIGFAIAPDDKLEDFFAEKLMILGTTADEKFDTRIGLRELIRRQREQSESIDVKFKRVEIFRDYPGDENVAVIIDDVLAIIKANGETTQFDMRCTSILEYQENRWKLIHWHASKPENVDSETDTFGIEQWKKKNEELEKIVAERTAELQLQKEELEHALADLKATQTQLVHSEKMASLGELTAGIAHEIQNPLNFVNNFSDVSKELLDEMKTELDAGNIEDAKEIAGDVIENLEKITHHGKRADAIVKGMLQHSRSGNPVKELTDLNALVDEYLRLTYHGLRARDKSFNATLRTDFDESVGEISLIPQDIGRVVLNLLTNAFYAVNEKKQANPAGYEPTVFISTKKLGDKVEIRISDNGNGIPKNVSDKIFQPFFTTKPTGKGTGLGLSLSYDIVTKGHGGTLSVETKSNESTTFIITLNYRS